ncbi:MAG: hypothetical protein AAF465_08315 [Pseudomonadota bacterium]
MTARLSAFLLIVLWLAAVLLAVGSKSYDPDEDEPVAPVLVDVSVINSGAITIENGDTRDSVSDLTLSVQFEKGGNAGITLREVPVDLDTSTGFDLEIIANDGENLLDGSVSVNVTSALDFGLARQPDAGQLSLLRDGTSTLITFDSTGVGVATGTATSVLIGFDDFRTLYLDQDRDLDQRFASKAYQVLETVWLMSRFGETAQQNITDNIDMLESMGRGNSLDLTCGNSTDATATYALVWTTDPAGDGLGQAGNGDAFEFSWGNCLFSNDDRYLDNEMQIANYQLNNDTQPRSLSMSAIYSSTIFGEGTISSSLPSTTQLRIDGTLVITAIEGATVTPDP